MSRPLAAVLILSAILKVGLAVFCSDLIPRYDEEEFLAFARDIASGGEASIWRAPGYQTFLAWSLRLDDGSTLAARVLQALMSVATTWLVFLAGRRAFSERAALAAAAFVAFYPSHVALSHLLWAETLFLLLVMFAFERLLALEESSDAGAAVLAGLALGLACLVRSAGLVLLPFSALWLVLQRGHHRMMNTALFVVAALALIAPWSRTATQRAGRFVVIDTNSGYNLWSGNNEWIPKDLQGIWSVGLPPANGTQQAWAREVQRAGLDPQWAALRPGGAWRAELPRRLAADGIQDVSGARADSWFRREGTRYIASHPMEFVTRIPLRIAGLWSPDFFLPRHVLRDWYEPLLPQWAMGLVLLTWACAAVPMLFGAAALAALRPAPFRSLAVTWTLATLGLHAITFGVSRMHQPLVPLLVLAAMGFLSTRPWKRFFLGGWLVGVLAAALWVLSFPALFGVYLAPGARHAELARTLGEIRHTPLPATRWAAWALADVEVAAGRPQAAERILSEPKHAREPWSLWLRALLAKDPAARRARLDEALAVDPGFEPARALRAADAAPVP